MHFSMPKGKYRIAGVLQLSDGTTKTFERDLDEDEIGVIERLEIVAENQDTGREWHLDIKFEHDFNKPLDA